VPKLTDEQERYYAELAEAAERGEFHPAPGSKALYGAAAAAAGRALLWEATEDDPENRALLLRVMHPDAS
jgi:hypothetical protein